MVKDEPVCSGCVAVIRPCRGVVRRLICQSEKPVWTDVHWVKNRSFVCPGEECPLCVTQTVRCVGYMLFGEEHGRGKEMTLGLLEFSPGAWSRVRLLLKMVEAAGHVSGQVVNCTRRKERGPVVLEPCEEIGTVVLAWATRERLIAAVAGLYRLPVDRWDEAARERIEEACGRSSVPKGKVANL
jgi:hypothetical protein